MRQQSTSLLLAVASVFAVSFMAYGQLGGPDGVLIPYQGRLEMGGAPANGLHDFRFSIFNDPTGSVVCDTHEITTLVSAGAFSAEIGPVDEVCVRGQDVYLEIEVSTDGTAGYTALAGRQRLYAATSATTSGSGDFAVQGNLAVAGSATAGPAFIGDVGHGPSWAAFAHQDGANTTDYALLARENPPLTILNTPPGGDISFRSGNSDLASMSASGSLSLNGGLAANGATSIIKRPEALSLGVTYTASTDGIVTAFANGVVGNPCQIFITVDTPAMPPITHYSFSANAHVSLPVPNGSTYLVQQNAGDCTGGRQWHFWPFGQGSTP